MKLIEFFVGLTASFDLIKYLFHLGWIYRNAVSLPASHVPMSPSPYYIQQTKKGNIYNLRY